MMIQFLLGLLLAGSGLALNGCAASKPVEIKPNGTVEVTLDAAKKSGSITVKLANLITFTMPPADPSLEWQISFHDTRYLRQYSEFMPPKEPGAGSTVSFLAMSGGSTRLRFVLVPISESRSVRPQDQQEVRITIR